MPAPLHTFIWVYGGLSASILAVMAALVVVFTGGQLGYRPQTFAAEEHAAAEQPVVA